MTNKILKKLILLNYCLVGFLAGGKMKKTYNQGAWFFLGTEFLFISISLCEFLIPLFPFKFNRYFLLALLIFLGYITQYGIKDWVYKSIIKHKIAQEYDNLSNKTFHGILGLLLFILSFASIFIVGINYCQGYFNR